MSRAYYNEWDGYAAAWLRNLIAAGHISAGDVDERSIVDVRADDLRGYTQVHFFAGIGGWSRALRLARWPDDRPVWTGSCPCQPFSAAGKRKGVEDERHLWPEFRRLIAECDPAVVFGEQVASKDGRLWLAGVRADLEALGYAVGAADLCAAGVGAPHIRQRLWWVGQSHRTGSQPGQQTAAPMGHGCAAFAASDADGRVADSHQGQRGRLAVGEGCEHHRAEAGWQQGDGEPQPGGAVGRLADSDSGMGHAHVEGRSGQSFGLLGTGHQGHWSRAEWLACVDGKSRRVEPGIFPLAHGVSARVGKLRAAGNAIVPQVAAEFITASLRGSFVERKAA